MGTLATAFTSLGSARRLLLAVAATCLVPVAASANLYIVTSVGTATPPGTLGGYTMVTFANDTRANGGSVDDVIPTPGSYGDVTFETAGGGTPLFLTHHEVGAVGSSVLQWSHSHTGLDVYYGEFTSTIRIVLPPNTFAFYFYAQPLSSTTISVTAEDNEGNTATQSVAGNDGAKYFGVYATTGSTVEWIEITGASQTPVAIGEFGIETAYDTPLPVELTRFVANVMDRNVVIDWTTASETDNAGFEIQRATADGEFVAIASHMTTESLRGLGTSASGKSYSFVDRISDYAVSAELRYRLYDVSISGERTLQREATVMINTNTPTSDMSIFRLTQVAPMPAGDNVKVEFSLAEASEIAMEIFDATGKMVATPVTGTFEAGTHSTVTSIADLTEGTYTIRLRNDRSAVAEKLVIVR